MASCGHGNSEGVAVSGAGVGRRGRSYWGFLPGAHPWACSGGVYTCAPALRGCWVCEPSRDRRRHIGYDMIAHLYAANVRSPGPYSLVMGERKRSHPPRATRMKYEFLQAEAGLRRFFRELPARVG